MQVLTRPPDSARVPHRGLADGEQVDLGGLSLRALDNPGHTDEHLSLPELDGRRIGRGFGGSLIVGSAARTALLGAERAGRAAQSVRGGSMSRGPRRHTAAA